MGSPFDFDFSLEDLPKYTKIENDTNPEDLEFHAEDLSEDPQKKVSIFTWCSDASKNELMACMGRGNLPQPPYFLATKGRSGKHFIHTFSSPFIGAEPPANQLGKFIQYLDNIQEGEEVEIYFHGIYYSHMAALQSAIYSCKGITKTYMSMCEPDPISACIFFIWVMGKVLEPIPYNTACVLEPVTMFGRYSVSSYHLKNSIENEIAARQACYNVALEKGILVPDDILKLNDGEGVLINDINQRIEAYNQRNGR